MPPKRKLPLTPISIIHSVTYSTVVRGSSSPLSKPYLRAAKGAWSCRKRPSHQPLAILLLFQKRRRGIVMQKWTPYGLLKVHIPATVAHSVANRVHASELTRTLLLPNISVANHANAASRHAEMAPCGLVKSKHPGTRCIMNLLANTPSVAHHAPLMIA
jgi:hypothetical protein